MKLDIEKLAREFCDRAPGLDGHRTFDFHPTGLSAFVAAVRGLVLEEAEKAFSDHSKEGREWVRGSLLDEARDLLAEAMLAMKSLHESAEPDPSTEDMDATIPGGSFAAFVNAHAALLYKIKHSSMAPTKEA